MKIAFRASRKYDSHRSPQEHDRYLADLTRERAKAWLAANTDASPDEAVRTADLIAAERAAPGTPGVWVTDTDARAYLAVIRAE